MGAEGRERQSKRESKSGEGEGKRERKRERRRGSKCFREVLHSCLSLQCGKGLPALISKAFAWGATVIRSRGLQVSATSRGRVCCLLRELCTLPDPCNCFTSFSVCRALSSIATRRSEFCQCSFLQTVRGIRVWIDGKRLQHRICWRFEERFVFL